MPKEEYSPLRQLLLEPGLPAVKALAELCRTDRQPLATCKITLMLFPLFIFFIYIFNLSKVLSEFLNKKEPVEVK